MNVDKRPKSKAEYMKLLKNKEWRLNNLYWIKGKDTGSRIKFKMKPEQWELHKNRHSRNVVLKARQLGMCLDPKSLVLTANLEWVEIRNLRGGDKVVSVDEFPPGGRGRTRKMRTATVEGVRTVNRRAYRIEFDTGKSIICTAQHPWLSRKSNTECAWRSIDGSGEAVSGALTVGTKIRMVTEVWEGGNYDDGWFGGMLDGEGSISKRNTGAGVSVSQVDGPVWNRLRRYAAERGYNPRIERDKAVRPSKFGRRPVNKLAFGRMDEMFRLIGQTRPTRFLGNEFWDGRDLPGKKSGANLWATIIGIQDIGDRDMVDLQTSEGTYIAEGLVSHNTTYLQIDYLDECLFNDNISAGVIAHNKEDAQFFFKEKIKYAYDNLPKHLKDWRPADTNSANELRFINGSVIRVGTSLRSGTYHRLHVSEYGKLCNLFPERAREARTGAMETVPVNGIIDIESTAEGQMGDFFDKCESSRKMKEEGVKPSALEYDFFFFPWWTEPKYTLDATPILTDDMKRYFKLLEERGINLSEGQKAWYISKKKSLGDDMKREYPSFPQEAFEASLEGAYFARQMEQIRAKGQICNVPIERGIPIETFWDLGRDTTAIWFFQRVGFDYRFIDYFQNSGEDMAYYVSVLKGKDDGGEYYNYGDCHLPHDGTRKSLASNMTPSEILYQNGFNVRIVPKTTDKAASIERTRRVLPTCWFDRTRCAEGIACLDAYRKERDPKLGTWKKDPRHDAASHGADAFMTFADGYYPEHEEEETVEVHSGRNQTTGY